MSWIRTEFAFVFARYNGDICFSRHGFLEVDLIKLAEPMQGPECIENTYKPQTSQISATCL